MKEQDLLFGVLSKTLQKSPEDLKRMIYNGDEISETAIESLLKEDTERVKRLKTEFETKGFDNGYSKGKGESLSSFESKVKEKFGVDTSAQGIDLIEELIIKNQKTSVDPNEVKKHPAYLELERNSVKKDEYNKVISEFENYKNSIAKREKMKVIHSKALEQLKKLNPVIEDNDIVAKRRMEVFLSEFDEFDYELDGDYVMPVRNGTRIQDEHGNPVGFESLVREKAQRNFVLNQQTYKSNAGNSKGQTSVINVPRNDKEYMQAVLKEQDPERRIAIKKAYEASKSND